MKKNYSIHALPMLALAVSLTLVACTDSNYDLGNLDKTIAIGNDEGFALPGNNSTSEMVLDDVLDIEDNDFVQVADDGSYYISRGADDDEIDPAMPVVDEIPLTLVGDESTAIYEILEVEDATRSIKKAASATEQSIYDFSFTNLEEVADVLGMSLANLTAGINVDLDFSDALKINVDYLRQLTIDLPDFFDVDITPKEENVAVSFIKDTNTLIIRNMKEDGVHLMMKLNGIDFNKGMTPDAHGCYLSFSAEGVSMVGSIYLDADYDFSAAAMARGGKEKNDKELNILCHSHMDEEVLLTRAKGFFNPEIDLGENIGSFEVNNLPDFLDDEEVHLNVKDPELRIWIDSNMDIQGLITGASINAIDAKGREVKIALDTDNLLIDPHTGLEKDANNDSLLSTRTTLIINETGVRPTNAPAHTYYGKPKDGKKLSDLLYNIPRKVTFDFDVKADERYEGTINLGYKEKETKEPWYKIQPSYEVYAPLAFADSSAIIYRDSITGWHKDLEDITLSEGATVVLLADVHNNIPLDLKMHASAIELVGDNTWKEMDKNLFEVLITDVNDNADFRIKAGTEKAKETTRIKITLKQKSKEGFKRIDGITYSASCLTPEDRDKRAIVLNNKSQQLKVDNIAITIRGKIVFDLND